MYKIYQFPCKSTIIYYKSTLDLYFSSKNLYDNLWLVCLKTNLKATSFFCRKLKLFKIRLKLKQKSKSQLDAFIMHCTLSYSITTKNLFPNQNQSRFLFDETKTIYKIFYSIYIQKYKICVMRNIESNRKTEDVKHLHFVDSVQNHFKCANLKGV